MPAVSRLLALGRDDLDGPAAGSTRRRAEEFSFALAVVLTPPVIAAARCSRLIRRTRTAGGRYGPARAQLLGRASLAWCSVSPPGMLALRWLSRWLEQGRWHLFGAYCLVAALIVVFWLG